MTPIPEDVMQKAEEAYTVGARLCSIPGCGKPYDSKGYCNAHYKRLRKHGDPLGGGTSKGALMRFIHEVALRHAGGECLAWPYAKKDDGYGTVYVDGKTAIVSRYVCELVNGPPPTPYHEAAHSCGKGHESCIAPGHLEWKTQAQNQADKLIHGTIRRGERCGTAKLTEPEAREIISMKGVEPQSSLAKRFGVARSTVAEIHCGENWAWLSNAEGASHV
jgi:hypothetical protein